MYPTKRMYPMIFGEAFYNIKDFDKNYVKYQKKKRNTLHKSVFKIVNK